MLQGQTHLDRSGFGLVWSGSADMVVSCWITCNGSICVYMESATGSCSVVEGRGGVWRVMGVMEWSGADEVA